MTFRKRLNRVIALLALTISSMTWAQSNPGNIQDTVVALQAGGQISVEGHRILTGQILAPFYTSREFQPAWTNDERRAQLLAIIASAGEHGLLPNDYFHNTLVRLEHNPARSDQEYDVLLSEALLRYVYSRRFGKVAPNSIDHDINFTRKLSEINEPHITIQALIDSDNLGAEINAHTEHGPLYLTLQSELARMVALENHGGWGTVSEGPTLHVGDTSVRVVEVRKRIAGHEQIDPRINNGSDQYDRALSDAVKQFQQDHSLDNDGLVGPATLAMMNMTVRDRIDQLRLSLERIRWVSSDVESSQDFVAVNIAGYRIYVIRDGKRIWSTRATVGKPYRQTPIFRGDIQYMEFNPTWTVPPGIHRNDTLPAIKRDETYLAKKHMSVLTPQGKKVDPSTVDWNSFGRSAPYIFRQEPGPWNSLGQVKFIFPNPHFVFLHDTNHRDLFAYPARAFSSGCIRVQDPMYLAELLLDNQPQWDRAAIDKTVDSKATKRVSLKQTLPVYILYLTAALDLDGSVLYLPDVYERDARLLSALDAPMNIVLPSKEP